MKKRGLGGIAYTKQDLKSQAKSCGSFYFTPNSMRFFNARLLAVYPVPGKNMTYFVEAKGGKKHGMFETIGRHYQIGVFKNCKVDTLGRHYGAGKGGVYKTAKQAKKIASAIASKAGGYGTTLKTRKRRSR